MAYSSGITIQNLVVSNLNRFGTNTHRGINYNSTGKLTMNNVNITIDAKVGYPANTVNIGQQKSIVEMNNSSIDFKLARTSAPGTATGISLSAGSTLTLNNTPVSVEAKTSGQKAYGIQGTSGEINLINSPIMAKGINVVGTALETGTVVINKDENSTLTEQ